MIIPLYAALKFNDFENFDDVPANIIAVGVHSKVSIEVRIVIENRQMNWNGRIGLALTEIGNDPPKTNSALYYISPFHCTLDVCISCCSSMYNCTSIYTYVYKIHITQELSHTLTNNFVCFSGDFRL